MWVAVGITIAATLYSANQQRKAGAAQEREFKRQAEEERIAAQGRMLQRTQELNAALSANQLGLAMAGIRAEGTPTSLTLESAKNIGLSEQQESLSTRLKVAQPRRAGKNAAAAGRTRATSTLLSGASTAVSQYNYSQYMQGGPDSG
jgi:hypothetical protein